MSTGLLTLLDDVASLLDDVATLTKVATKKTAGVLGDDLALNAEQVAGVATDRELPVVWAVFKGSAINKLILVPSALAISAIAPWAILPLLMVGGAFLCFEGFEKIAHKFLHPKAEDDAEHRAKLEALTDPAVDIVAFERDKIRGAIRTDIILSAEIIVISLGTVADRPFATQAAVLAVIAVIMTVGVYGFVAGIVKLDDGGAALLRRDGALPKAIGRAILRAAPWLMKGLSIAGTAAMFLVGGGILVHGVPPLHHLAESSHAAVGMAIEGGTGVIAGGILVAIVTGIGKLRGKTAG
jgi:predicted DNA repair protein MutK